MGEGRIDRAQHAWRFLGTRGGEPADPIASQRAAWAERRAETDAPFGYGADDAYQPARPQRLDNFRRALERMISRNRPTGPTLLGHHFRDAGRSRALAISPDGTQVLVSVAAASASEPGRFGVLEVGDTELNNSNRMQRTKAEQIVSACFRPGTGERTVVTRVTVPPYSHVVHVGAAEDAGLGRRLCSVLGKIHSFDWHPDGHVAAVAGEDGQVYVIDAEGPHRLDDIAARIQAGATVHALRFDPTGRYLATACRYGVTLWDWRSGARLSFRPRSPEIFGFEFQRHYQLSFRPDGEALAVQSFAARDHPSILSIANGKLLDERSAGPGGETVPGTLVVGPKTGKLQVITEDFRGHEVDWETGDVTRSFRLGVKRPRRKRILRPGGRPVDPIKVTTVAYDPDERYLLTGLSNAVVTVWDAETGRRWGRE